MLYPAIITTGPGLTYFLNTTATYGSISNNINVTELLVTHSTEKIITNSTQNLIQINKLLITPNLSPGNNPARSAT